MKSFRISTGKDNRPSCIPTREYLAQRELGKRGGIPQRHISDMETR